jgi:hypothetical protein
MGKFLALLPRTRKVLDSYLEPATGYPDKHGVLSPCPCTRMPGYHIKIDHENFHVLSSWLITNLSINGHYITAWADPVAARSKACVCGHSLAEIAGSNSPEGMDVCLLWVMCVVRLITRPEESYQVWCVWVWSWSIDNEEVLAIGAPRIFLWGGRGWPWDYR